MSLILLHFSSQNRFGVLGRHPCQSHEPPADRHPRSTITQYPDRTSRAAAEVPARTSAGALGARPSAQRSRLSPGLAARFLLLMLVLYRVGNRLGEPARCLAHLAFSNAASLARPSGVLGPVLMPPWFGQRPPLPRPLRRHGCPALVRAPQGLFRSSRSRAHSSEARAAAQGAQPAAG